MFNMFKSKPKIDVNKQLVDLLFPPLQVDPNDESVYVDFGVDSNLDMILLDLEDGVNDAKIRNSLNDVVDRLYKARKLLDAYRAIDKDKMKYIRVQSIPTMDVVENE